MKGWLLASVDGKTMGLVPANYVKVLGKRRGTKESNYPVPNELDSFSQSIQNNVPSNSGHRTEFNHQSNPCAPGLQQSQSAANFEQQLQTGFGDESSVPDHLDSVFKNSAGDNLNSLESLPDLPDESRKPPGDK